MFLPTHHVHINLSVHLYKSPSGGNIPGIPMSMYIPTFAPTKRGVVPHGNVRKLTTFISTCDAPSIPCVDFDETRCSLICYGWCPLPDLDACAHHAKTQMITIHRQRMGLLHAPLTSTNNIGLSTKAHFTRNRKTPDCRSRTFNSRWVTLFFCSS